jgi:hypothetical protein
MWLLTREPLTAGTPTRPAWQTHSSLVVAICPIVVNGSPADPVVRPSNHAVRIPSDQLNIDSRKPDAANLILCLHVQHVAGGRQRERYRAAKLRIGPLRNKEFWAAQKQGQEQGPLRNKG